MKKEKKSNKKVMYVAIILLIFIFILILILLNLNYQTESNCSENEVLFWYWTNTDKKIYICIPDPNNCRSLGKLCNDTDFDCYESICNENINCKVMRGSSCYLCDDIFVIGCYPKDTQEYEK